MALSRHSPTRADAKPILGRALPLLLLAAVAGAADYVDYDPLLGSSNLGMGDYDGDGRTDLAIYVADTAANPPSERRAIQAIQSRTGYVTRAAYPGPVPVVAGVGY